ncbi:MAG: hypothetical protein R3D67_19190 [Hyphomicrobiaceae bacterium]
MLTLSRNLGLTTGAALMGGIFAAAIHSTSVGDPDTVARAMNITFAFAGALILLALVLAIRGIPSSDTGARD